MPPASTLFKPGNPGGPGRPPAPKCIADLLRWSGGLQAPEKLVEEMRRVFGIPGDQPLTVDQATILRVRVEALKGNIQHVDFWARRTEGNAVDTLRLEGGARLEVVEEIVEAKHDEAQQSAPADAGGGRGSAAAGGQPPAG